MPEEELEELELLEVVEEPVLLPLGKTGDDDVIHRFAGVTHGVIYDVGSRIGSCCYCEKDDQDVYSSQTNCVDYVSENYCDSIGGIFDFGENFY